MSQENQLEEGPNMPDHSEENDIDLPIPAKRQRFAEEEEEEEALFRGWMGTRDECQRI